MIWGGVGCVVVMTMLCFGVGWACHRHCRQAKKDAQQVEDEAVQVEGMGVHKVAEGETEGDVKTEKVNDCGCPVLKKKEVIEQDEATVETMC